MHAARSVIQQPATPLAPKADRKVCARPGCTQFVSRARNSFCSARCRAAGIDTICARTGCETRLTPVQLRRKQIFCSHACHLAHRYDHSLKKRVIEQELNYSTVLCAKVEQRVIEINGEIKIRSPRRCGACEKAVGIIGFNRLCETCRASGLRWCGEGKHAVPLADYRANNRACSEHLRIKAARDKLRRRGVEVDPPYGFVPVAQVAAQIGYSVGMVRRAIREGWLPASDVWQRCVEGMYFVRKRDRYPAWGTRATQ